MKVAKEKFGDTKMSSRAPRAQQSMCVCVCVRRQVNMRVCVCNPLPMWVCRSLVCRSLYRQGLQSALNIPLTASSDYRHSLDIRSSKCHWTSGVGQAVGEGEGGRGVGGHWGSGWFKWTLDTYIKNCYNTIWKFHIHMKKPDNTALLQIIQCEDCSTYECE